MNNTITLKEYLSKPGDRGTFTIPNYQRGYVWGQYKAEYKVDSVTNMLSTLLDGYKNDHDVFVQGITAYEEGNGVIRNIYLVDGQQRTTFFFLLLKWLGYTDHFEISYAIRKESDQFLKQELSNEIAGMSNIPEKDYLDKIEDEPFQDIYFFKKTLCLINRSLRSIEKEKGNFITYLEKKVKFLYITIDDSQASIIFSMMNGQKAQMKQEELVKSELLRCSSLSGGKIGEAENVMIRSRLAREWDQWMYWWNRDDVVTFFHTRDKNEDKPRILGWLLPLALGKKDVSFEDYRESKLKDMNRQSVSVKDAKAAFKELRLLQKQIEDAYDDPKVYNYIGAILNWYTDNDARYTFLEWYFNMKKQGIKDTECAEQLEKYFNWSMIGVTHGDIKNDDSNVFRDKYHEFRESIQDNNLYNTGYEKLSRWLLCRNIAEDNSQGEGRNGRKFDFDIWRNRSLEHIFPKSRVWHMSNGTPVGYDDRPIQGESIQELESDCGKVRREDMQIKDEKTGEIIQASEHSLGNLVLLYRRDNSEFNDADFARKKEIFFGTDDEAFFKSRHLIHTIKIFARSTWTPTDIAQNKRDEIKYFETYFSKYMNSDE